jgi:hypothetical protein
VARVQWAAPSSSGATLVGLLPRRVGSSLRLGVVAAFAACVLLAGGVAIAATRWGVALGSSSKAQAKATTPAAPTGVTAKCLKSTGGTATSSTTAAVKVSWTAAALATGYTVWESKTSGSYTKVAKVTTTSWSSSTLTNGSYLFKVTTAIGSKWSSAKSRASATVTIKSSTYKCTG